MTQITNCHYQIPRRVFIFIIVIRDTVSRLLLSIYGPCRWKMKERKAKGRIALRNTLRTIGQFSRIRRIDVFEQRKSHVRGSGDPTRPPERRYTPSPKPIKHGSECRFALARSSTSICAGWTRRKKPNSLPLFLFTHRILLRNAFVVPRKLGHQMCTTARACSHFIFRPHAAAIQP